jgi:hypothetical protein
MRGSALVQLADGVLDVLAQQVALLGRHVPVAAALFEIGRHGGTAGGIGRVVGLRFAPRQLARRCALLGRCAYATFDAYGPASAIVSISAIRADRMTVLASLVDLFASSRGNRLPLVLEKPCEFGRTKMKDGVQGSIYRISASSKGISIACLYSVRHYG